MKNRKLLVLSLVTLVVIVAAVITSRLRAPQSTMNTQVLFPELAGKINDVAAIIIKGNKGTVELKLVDARWVLASAGNYPALFNKIKQNVVGMSELRIVAEKTDNPEFYARLGVEGPDAAGTKSMLVTLQDKSGQTIAGLIAGNNRQSSSNKPGLYVRKPDSSQALLVEGSLDISDKPLHWFETDLFDISSSRVQEVHLKYPRSGEPLDDLVIRKNTSEQPDFAVNLAGLGQSSSIPIIANRISRGLEQMRADNVQPLQNFNFPENETYTTTVRTFDGLITTARLTSTDKAYYANFTFAYDPVAAAVIPKKEDTAAPDAITPEAEPVSPEITAKTLHGNLSAWVFEIPDFLYEALTTRPEKFRKLPTAPE